MKNLIILFTIGISSLSNGQVGVGTITPHSSAILEVSSTNKGLLLPRVALTSRTDATTINTPPKSLIVYNTANAGNGTQVIQGNRVALWDGDDWGTFTFLTEIRGLKVPIDFARLSETTQTFTATELASINTPNNLIPITWASDDVLIDNPTDVTHTSTTEMSVLTSSFYQISGSFSVKIETIVAGAATNLIITLQKQTAGSTTWESIVAANHPLEQLATSKVVSVVFPNIVHEFAKDDKIRFVVSRPLMTATTGTYATGSALETRLAGDIKKSIRITRLTE